MKILFVSSGLDPITGGTATAAVGMAVAARKAGLDVTMILPYDPQKPELIAENISILNAHRVTLILSRFSHIGRGRRLAKKWGISLNLAWKIWRRAGGFDVIHAHSPYVFSSMVALLAARYHHKPFILSPHEGLTRFDRSKASVKILLWLKEFFAKIYFARANAIIFASDLEERDSVNGQAGIGKSAQKSAQSDNNQAKLYNLPLPVMVNTHPRNNFSPMNENAPINLGYLGRIDAKKNLPILISALSIAVNRTNTNLHLIVAGGGDQELLRQIQHQAGSHNLQAHITWLGFVNQSAREKFLADIDILVVPSVFESFGLVAAEAMAAGVPVIASPTVGVAEDITNYQAGLVIPPRPDALAVALSRLNRDDLAKWGHAAQKLVSEKYAYDKIGEGLRQIYQELVR